MTLTLQPAASSDIPSLISILFSAFADDKLLMTCYPDKPANHEFWIRTVQSQMQYEGCLLFKVVKDDGQIVGWAKWLLHRPQTAKAGEERKEDGDEEERQGALNPNDAPSEDMDMDACRKLADGQYSMLGEVIGGRGCYWLNALAVHPSHQRQGAATMLVAAGTDLADHDGLECFSACTTQANENMKGVFNKAGFEVVAERPVVGGLSVFAGYRKAREV